MCLCGNREVSIGQRYGAVLYVPRQLLSPCWGIWGCLGASEMPVHPCVQHGEQSRGTGRTCVALGCDPMGSAGLVGSWVGTGSLGQARKVRGSSWNWWHTALQGTALEPPERGWAACVYCKGSTCACCMLCVLLLCVLQECHVCVLHAVCAAGATCVCASCCVHCRGVCCVCCMLCVMHAVCAAGVHAVHAACCVHCRDSCCVCCMLCVLQGCMLCALHAVYAAGAHAACAACCVCVLHAVYMCCMLCVCAASCLCCRAGNTG